MDFERFGRIGVRVVRGEEQVEERTLKPSAVQTFSPQYYERYDLMVRVMEIDLQRQKQINQFS
jgi:hypothetical protein